MISMWRQCAVLALCNAAVLAGSSAVRAESLEVDQDRTYIYEAPNSESAVMRRLYQGEQIEAEGMVIGADGRRYAVVGLGVEAKGYVLASKLVASVELVPRKFKKESIVRDERPLGVGVRGLGELFGLGLDLRYLPLTRLGIGFHIGPVIDNWHAKGTSWSIGLIGFAAKTPISPFFEAGFVSLGYHERLTILKIVALYLSLGIEWQSRWGGYVQAGGIFVRSISINVAARYAQATSQSFTAGTYGIFEDYLSGTDLFQAIRPTFTVGYAF